MSEKDSLLPFSFDDLSVHGALVQLDETWRRLQQDRNYAEPVAGILGEAASAMALLASSMKSAGSVTLQIAAQGALGMLVMQANRHLELRGMVGAKGVSDTDDYASLMQGARCAVTVYTENSEQPYQGIVAVTGESLADSLTGYFAQSVQVPSHLHLRVDKDFCGGLLLQQRPGAKPVSEDDWNRLGYVAATLKTQELQQGATPELLQKLFAEDDVRLYPKRPVCFKCRCSKERVENVIRLLGEEDAHSAVREQGLLEVACEYCGERHKFDEVDVSGLFATNAQAESSRIH